MKCEHCRFAPPVGAEGYQDECYNFEKYGTIWKDGKEGCTLSYQTLAKSEREYDEYLSRMGTEMGLEMDFEMYGWDMEKTIKHCKHMIGMDRRKCYHRHGRTYYKAYRNGWGNGGKPKPDFEHLCEKAFGYMRRSITEQGQYVYHLTDEGIEWLGRQTKTTIKIED